ncbi:sugar MFS transporter [Chondromyces apiculatus]|uniref:sugar MFS transporter n=1 Tax=Chondromyces apiculatus TaxID=51 RepID=UPI0018CC2261|nr:sugar MFS transporter [Chondromyces apiculatus]
MLLLFFAWGFATVLVDALVPKLKGLFALTYTEVMLTQFCFFLAYLLMSLPASMILSRIGYLRAVVGGLVVMALGCLMFAPAARLGVYPGFLFALFVMASGITLLQVAANPLMALLGAPDTAPSRLTFAQFFNAVGTTVGPHVGATLILASGVSTPDPTTLSPAELAAARQVGAQAVQTPFLLIAVGLLVLAVLFWVARNAASLGQAEHPAALRDTLKLLGRPALLLAVMSIFLYVGAEVSLGSLMTNFLMLPGTLALPAMEAGRLVGLYWGGAMVGRLLGGFVLRRLHPGTALAACALAAATLVGVAVVGTGVSAGVALIAVGLFNAIMFPTIFTLGLEGMGEETAQASGLLCMAIVGGAVVPLLTGVLADHTTLSLALLCPLLCYVWIALYGWMHRRRAAVA